MGDSELDMGSLSPGIADNVAREADGLSSNNMMFKLNGNKFSTSWGDMESDGKGLELGIGQVTELRRTMSDFREASLIGGRNWSILFALMSLSVGSLSIFRGMKSLVEGQLSANIAAASGETALAVASQNYAGIAYAALGASIVASAFGAGYYIGEQHLNVRNVNIKNPKDRRRISSIISQTGGF